MPWPLIKLLVYSDSSSQSLSHILPYYLSTILNLIEDSFFHCYFCKFCPIFKVGSDDLQTKPHKGHWMDFWFCFPFSNKSVMNFMAKPQSKMYMYFSNSLANWNKTLWVSVALYPKSAFNQFYDIKKIIVTSIWLGPNLWFWFAYILPF